MKITNIILFMLLYAFSSIIFAQEVGEKVYKKVESNGKIVEKWVLYYSYTEYDVNGNVVLEKETYGGDTFYEYNEKGQLIHQKGPYSNEYWYKYDDYGNKIWEKNSNNKEISNKELWIRFMTHLKLSSQRLTLLIYSEILQNLIRQRKRLCVPFL